MLYAHCKNCHLELEFQPEQPIPAHVCVETGIQCQFCVPKEYGADIITHPDVEVLPANTSPEALNREPIDVEYKDVLGIKVNDGVGTSTSMT